MNKVKRIIPRLISPLRDDVERVGGMPDGMLRPPIGVGNGVSLDPDSFDG
ncbi:MAG: hypothetical protein AAGA21_10730 [Pseudomonadota bacterium]